MATEAKVAAKLTLNNVDFNNKLDESERKANSFSGKVQSAFNRAFTKDRGPMARGEKALSGFIGDLATGGPVQALTMLAAKITGLGLAAGVGVGAAIEVFRAAKEQINKTDEAYKDLTKTIASPLPKSSVAALGEEIERTNTQTKNLEKQSSTFFSRLRTGAQKFAPGGFDTSTLKNDDPEKVATNEERIAQGRARAREAQREQAKLELDIANNRRRSLMVSQAEGEVFEQNLKTQQRLEKVQEESGLTKPGRDVISNFKRFVAAKAEDKLAKDQIKERDAARESEFKTAKKLLDLERADLPAAQKKNLATSIQLTAINERLKSANLPESERKSLTLQKMQKENELREGTRESQNRFAFGTIARREFEDKDSFGSIARRAAETNDANAFGSLANAAAQRGETPMQNPSQDLAQLLQQLVTLTTQAWATP